MKILALLSVFLALPMMAQTAKVIELSPEDAKQAKALYEQRDNAIKQIAELEKKVRTKHLQDKDGRAKDGWSSGFQYSEDFRFIVPGPPQMYIASGVTTIPAILTPGTWTCPPTTFTTPATICGVNATCGAKSYSVTYN